MHSPDSTPRRFRRNACLPFGVQRPFGTLGLRLLPAAVLVCAAACTTDQCFDNRNSLPLAGFYSSEAVPQAISLDSVSIYGVGVPGDSVLHDSVRGLSQTYLPFLIGEGLKTTRYVIRYLQQPLGRYGVTDTITFSYNSQPEFVSSACGVVYYFEDVDITTTHMLIDSVTCPKGIITNEAIENIRIYFRVNTQDQ